jgi:ABC-type tungstate transport system substrate-binding protein
MRTAIRSLVVVLNTLGVLGFLLWLLFRALGHWFDHQNLNVRTAVIGGIALVLVPIVTYFANRASDQRRAVDQSLRLEKLSLYQTVLEFFMLIYEGDVPGKSKPTPDETAR